MSDKEPINSATADSPNVDTERVDSARADLQSARNVESARNGESARADLQSARNVEPIKIEMFYTLVCPNCRILKRMLQEVLPEFGDRFKMETTMANLPIGMVRTMKLGIYAVPTLLINNEIVYREVPSKQDLINKLKTY